jgi:outer membrane receptor for ferrienterochelin and colicins
VELPHYTLWHTAVSYEVTPQWTLRAGIENLGDEKLKENSVNFTYEERGRYAYVTTNLSF